MQPAKKAAKKATPVKVNSRLMFLLLRRYRRRRAGRALAQDFDASEGLVGQWGTGVFEARFVVIDQGSGPLLLLFVILGHAKISLRLDRFQLADDALRLLHAPVVWIERHEIGESRDSLASHTLIVVGFASLLVVGQGGIV